MSSNIIVAKKFTDEPRANVSAHLKALKLTTLASILSLNLSKIYSEQVQEVLRAFLALEIINK